MSCCITLNKILYSKYAEQILTNGKYSVKVNYFYYSYHCWLSVTTYVPQLHKPQKFISISLSGQQPEVGQDPVQSYEYRPYKDLGSKISSLTSCLILAHGLTQSPYLQNVHNNTSLREVLFSE